MQKHKNDALLATFEKMTDADQFALQVVAEALAKKNERRPDLKLILGGLSSVGLSGAG